MINLRKFLILNIGCLLAAFPAVFFFGRTTTPPGGMYSLALIISNFMGWGSDSDIVSNIAFLLNVPLLFLAFAIFGFSYLVKVIYASLAYPIYIKIINATFLGVVNNFYPSMFMTIVIGGLLQGIGVALTIYSGANTGGTDILGQALNKFVPMLSVGSSIAIFNLLIMLVSIFVLSATNTAYGVLTVLVVSYAIDYTLKFLKRF